MAQKKENIDDDESYWETSKASKLKSFGINQFDDDAQADFKAIYNYLDSVVPDEDDELDVIGWDGSALARNSKAGVPGPKKSSSTDGLSARYRPSEPMHRKVEVTRADGSKLEIHHMTEDHPLARQSAAQQALSISDVLKADEKKKEVPSKTDVAKLEAEVNYLRRTVYDTKKERWVVIKPVETVKRMIYGQPYSLEMYRSKEHKLELLDEAIKLHDGNAIIATVLFLRDTVKAAIFNLELMLRPVAVDHYVNYLRASGDSTVLMDILGMLGRHEEAAMIKYKQVSKTKDPEKKCKALEACKRAHFDSEPSLQPESSLIQEQVATLSRQIPVEKSDQQVELAGDPFFKQYPRAASVVDQPVITWLFYCCFYHYKLGENNFASPLAIRRDNKLTDKQYLWAAISARAKLKMWKDIDAMFESKTWFKGVQLKCPMDAHRVLPVLQHYNAPRDVMNKYCKLIENIDTRLEVGKKLNCHETVIDTLVALKDRKQLIAYQSTFKGNTQEWFYAADILRNTSLKWKN